MLDLILKILFKMIGFNILNKRGFGVLGMQRMDIRTMAAGMPVEKCV